MEHPLFSLSVKKDMAAFQYEQGDVKVKITPAAEEGRANVFDRDILIYVLSGRVASITGQARSTLTRENGQPTDSNLAQPSSVILLRARTPICASVF